MAYCIVNGARYGLLVDDGNAVKSGEQFLKDIATNVTLSQMSANELETIVSDLVWEKTNFASWAALAKEIEIRRVGYAAEAMMRRMYELNRSKDETYQATKVALAKQEQQLFAAQQDSATRVSDGDYKVLQKAVEDAKAKNEAADKGTLRWNPPTFPTYSYRNNQLMEWWLGLRQDEPKSTNCWECALLAFVNTESLRVPRNYMVWCVEQIDTNVFAEFNEKMPEKSKISRMYSHAAKNMDCYFPRYGVPRINENKERCRPQNDDTSCFDLPLDVIIPRGRLLIFDYMAHVAISTGELRPITTPEGRAAWGRDMGHGILDLNAWGETIRERTIEDFARAGNCNNQLIVAPFPICNERGTITIKGNAPPTPDQVTAYRKTLDKEATDAYDAKIQKLEIARQQARANGKLSETQIEKNYKNGLSAAKADFEKAIVQAVKKIDKKVKQLNDLKPAPREENFPLSYEPFDPYNGKVTF